MPEAISEGVSYTDYWQMTFGEIIDFIKFSRKKQEAEIESEMQKAAFTAYWSGAISRAGGRIPDCPQKMFPSLFGRTSDGQIKAENWQESERALRQIAERFNQNKRR